MTHARRAVASPLLFALALVGCGGAGDGGPTGTLRQPVLGGAEFDGPGSPVLYLQSPEGGCTGVLVGATLVLTARHCVARTSPGRFSCTASGDLVSTGTGAGQIGVDDPPSSLAFFTSDHAAAASTMGGGADALGVRILSTQTPTACRDDLALVVLDRPITAVAPAPLRLDRPTQVGELVSVWGYGLTERVEGVALRTRTDISILAVGPDTPSTITQQAPVRSLRVGPVTCQGDSGGPMIAKDTGAVVALVSLGSQAGAGGPFCAAGDLTDTIGPRLAAYRSLILAAFQAAGSSPVAEEGPPDASSTDAAPLRDAALTGDSDPSPDAEGGTSAPDTGLGGDALDWDAAGDGLRPEGPILYRATGGSCSMARGPRRPARAALTLVLGLAALAVGRRRR